MSLRMSTNLSATLNESHGVVQPWSCVNPTAEKISKTFAYCLLFVVSMAGNTLIGIIVYKTKTMRKPTDVFIVSMAMSDLLIPIFLYPRIITSLYMDSWLISAPLGQVLCKLVPFIGYVSIVVSIQSLVLIAVDRFGAVLCPLRSPIISSKLCPFFIFATWIIALAISSPHLLAAKVIEFPGGRACVWLPSEILWLYAMYTAIFFFYTSLILISTLYNIIYFKLKTRKIPGEQSFNTERQREKRERNVLKMGVTIVLAFTLCWLPYNISKLLFHSDRLIPFACGFIHFESIARFLAYANCAVNPCICFIFSGNYRRGLKSIIKCFQSGELRVNQVAL